MTDHQNNKSNGRNLQTLKGFYTKEEEEEGSSFFLFGAVKQQKIDPTGSQLFPKLAVFRDYNSTVLTETTSFHEMKKKRDFLTVPMDFCLFLCQVLKSPSHLCVIIFQTDELYFAFMFVACIKQSSAASKRRGSKTAHAFSFLLFRW